jgi:hypothetical protein
MNRGRTDSNEALRQHRRISGENFYGNSSVVARACDNFWRDRGMPPAGAGWGDNSLLFGSAKPRKAGRCLRENKADTIAAEIEQGWQA